MKVNTLVLVKMRIKTYRAGRILQDCGDDFYRIVYLSKANSWKIKIFEGYEFRVVSEEEKEMIENLLELGQTFDLDSQKLYIQLAKTMASFDNNANQQKFL